MVERARRRLHVPEQLGIVGFVVGLVGAALAVCLAMCAVS